MAWQWWDGFDMRMCGKWKSEEFELFGSNNITFLSIGFESVAKGAQVKFGFDGENYGNTAFYVESSYDSLYFFHNDRKNRMEYILTLDETDVNKMKCSLAQRWSNMEKDIAFTRISEPLSEEELEKYEKYKNRNKVPPKDASKIEILREYAEYGKDNLDVKFEYRFDERENMLDIIEKYDLDELVKGKSDAETAIALMKWLCERYKHGNPPGGLAQKRTPQALMEFADKNEGRTNCRGLALILAQLIRAYNIKAFHITCMPYEEPFDDCHVVVCVYCESLKKWIMLDPSANLYLKNKSGEIIGVDEFREILIADGELVPNKENTNWGNEGSMPNLDEYRDYMAKNLIRLARGTVGRYGCDQDDGQITLIPEKYMRNEAKNFDEARQKQFITSREDFWQI